MKALRAFWKSLDQVPQKGVGTGLIVIIAGIMLVISLAILLGNFLRAEQPIPGVLLLAGLSLFTILGMFFFEKLMVVVWIVSESIAVFTFLVGLVMADGNVSGTAIETIMVLLVIAMAYSSNRFSSEKAER